MTSQKPPQKQGEPKNTVVKEVPVSGAYNVQGKIGNQSFSLSIEPPQKGWFDASIYAPTLPGIFVALAGLWVSHLLAAKRDRRKEVLDLCNSVKELLEEATKSAIEGWITDDLPKRRIAIIDTKSKIQALGIAVTTLNKRSVGRFVLIKRFLEKRNSIDAIKLVADFRRTATGDPFEVPDRPASEGKIGNITSRRAAILVEIDDGFLYLYK